jgi:hypothetical protein
LILLAVVADALRLSTVADLEAVGITGPAACAIAAFFGNLDEEDNLELEPLPLPLPDPLPEAKTEPTEPEPNEPEPEPPSGPMAGFDEAAVLAWLGSVPGLTPAQLAAAAAEMAEDEYDGPLLAAVTTKNLRRLLKGTEAEAAVPVLLAARDAHLAASVNPASEEQKVLRRAHPSAWGSMNLLKI